MAVLEVEREHRARPHVVERERGRVAAAPERVLDPGGLSGLHEPRQAHPETDEERVVREHRRPRDAHVGDRRGEAEGPALAHEGDVRGAALDRLGRVLLPPVERLHGERQASLARDDEAALLDVAGERGIGRARRLESVHLVGPEQVEVLRDLAPGARRRDDEAPEDVQRGRLELRRDARAHEQRPDRELGIRPGGEKDLGARRARAREQEQRREAAHAQRARS